MFVFVFEAALFKFTLGMELSQLPPTSATAPRKSVYFKPGSFYTTWPSFLLYGTYLSMRGWPPRVPAGGYAAGCSQERQAPRLVRAYEAAAPKYTLGMELSQLPPTSA